MLKDLDIANVLIEAFDFGEKSPASLPKLL